MGNPVKTKKQILEVSAKLFNKSGYRSTSLSDITSRLGLTKGAIYAHFGNKEGLEVAALNYMAEKMMQAVAGLIKAEKTTSDKLNVVIDYFSAYVVNPPFEGGCPLMNAGIEADDAHPKLKKQVSKVMTKLNDSLMHIIENGKKHQEVKSTVDTSMFASVFISALEGGIVMMNVTGEKKHMRNVVAFLKNELTNSLNTER